MNKSEAAAYLPFIQALANGQSVEFSPSEGRNNDWINRNEFDFTATASCYRIKPDPVMVPLGPEDVPPGSVVGRDDQWMLVTSAHMFGMQLGRNAKDMLTVTWEEAQRLYEIKRPGEDWKPCCKPA